MRDKELVRKHSPTKTNTLSIKWLSVSLCIFIVPIFIIVSCSDKKDISDDKEVSVEQPKEEELKKPVITKPKEEELKKPAITKPKEEEVKKPAITKPKEEEVKKPVIDGHSLIIHEGAYCVDNPEDIIAELKEKIKEIYNIIENDTKYQTSIIKGKCKTVDELLQKAKSVLWIRTITEVEDIRIKVNASDFKSSFLKNKSWFKLIQR